ncbi:GNAT family N-acetyltransferase [Clostridium sp. SHJSY1]|uniref:GNAT family N-acetyltransferase n=1 Tax=Clostridium sp. SHJSY1 TaxID=2942483 RepID=UPI0028750A27|nr:GNAT family N-acetyltransferase [Clostridium sp. SHJSY1]MDS0524675.1 GNAT family N-acetyltransferase [Clostridium sp. SHJSY1]
MINLLKETEIEYIRCFSKEKKDKSIIRFWDEKFQDSYANNLTLLNENVDENIVVEIINKEIDRKIKEEKEFLLFEFHGNISKEAIKRLSVWPSRIDKLDYMSIETKNYGKIKYREDCLVKKVITKEDFDDLITINILDYAPLVGKNYAKRRIGRKVNIYKDNSNKLSAFISHIGENPVGSCELLINKKTAKIEDFGVLSMYQKQGVGKSILFKILKSSYDDRIDVVYVITESKGKAKEIYKKCGFKKVGEKTQLIFSL